MDSSGSLDHPPDVLPGLKSIGSIHGSNSSPAFRTPVRKSGYTTGLTHGAVRIKNLSVSIAYPLGTALFDDQIGVIGTSTSSHFAQGGDSGSLVVDDKNLAIGLLFAIAGAIDLAYVNPIEPILKHFGISIP